jgi:acetylornithine/succinyldiaminopimelate/putrescine aminotransferase
LRTSEIKYQSFLANGFDEALAGAIKLARYSASNAGRPTTGLIVDDAGRLGNFVAATLPECGQVQFVPGLVVVDGDRDDPEEVLNQTKRFGLLVMIPSAEKVRKNRVDLIHRVMQRDTPLLITCVNRESLNALRRNPGEPLQELLPDIVVFDESFVNHDVPFSAFTARRELYDLWNRPGKTTFHSTTFQPNTLSSLHFMRYLEQMDPEFYTSIARDLKEIEADLDARKELFRRSYSPSLEKVISATEFDKEDVRAAGNFVYVNGRRIFDCVSGVACSIRGHNPPEYVQEMDALQEEPDCREKLVSCLRELTSLESMLPAVSGATAVENALKVGLIAQYPRRHVLALQAGFAGKTLLSLTGTANPRYKQHIDPLYPDVSYVDPFASDAISQIEEVLATHAVAIVQVELIQAVGGVRQVPEEVIQFLARGRDRHGYLLLVDEIQTGMYRTGPFALSVSMGLMPDLLVLGKGTSDMMFPFSLVLYSAEIQARGKRTGSNLIEEIEERYGYEFGYRTVLNVLRQAEKLRLSRRVAESGSLWLRLLQDGLDNCMSVHEVRVYGLLIGIELDISRGLRRRFRKWVYQVYLFNMLRHPRYPVLVGFCQYEPHILKITPALTVEPAEIQKACATIVEVLTRPFYRLLTAVVWSLLNPRRFLRRKHEHRIGPAHDVVKI